MTYAARDFITPLTLATLSKQTVLSEFYDTDSGEWNNHVELGLWADLMVIAPASANTISKCATGICDNLLTAIYLSAKCPVVFAPAMDRDMYLHPASVKNVKTLQSFGNIIFEPESGELASGLEGKGRLLEPEKILDQINAYFKTKNVLSGKRILINAGPTQEKIDPVRFISNHSSGRMGYAIAQAYCDLGATVDLVSGPVNIGISHSNLTVHNVKSADEMALICEELFQTADITILAAAVADFKIKQVSTQKIKKETDYEFSLELIKNSDIAFNLGKKKVKNQILVGFALETENLIENAKLKLVKKNLDLIIINSPSETTGFDHETNQITIIDKRNKTTTFKLKSKKDIAYDIIEAIEAL
jgi:phosphopantothenoylcysteine decarboxylase/phosphopantothenate--cysteine ligase